MTASGNTQPGTAPPARRGEVTAVLWATGAGADRPGWLRVTEASLGPAVARVVAGGPPETETAAAFLNRVWRERGGHLLVASAGVVAPTGLLDRAGAALEADPRIATVSFLTNDGGLLSFPARNQAAPLAPAGLDQESVTARLRGRTPAPAFAALPFALGPLVLVSEEVLRTVGPFEDAPSGGVRAVLADLSLRARARGFAALADCGTFVLKPSDLNPGDWSAEPYVARPLSDLEREDEQWVQARHPMALPLLHADSQDPSTAFALGHSVARVKVEGLRVLVDGRSLSGPQQGTQTGTMYLVEALGRHPDVREICVAVTEDVPAHARHALSGDRVTVSLIPPEGLAALGHFDIGHRPFLPGGAYLPAEWHGVCERHLVTFLDLIAYDIGPHFRSPEGWLGYRELVRTTAREADGVVVISADVHAAVDAAALAGDTGRVFTVPLGTDHIETSDAAGPPEELVRRGFGGEGTPFLLCLGTNYACRNRDVAIAAWHLLKQRGYELDLVLAGGAMPFGTARVAEVLDAKTEALYDLPPVSAPERNWLLARASVVLCASSADGFGLVPFEAAWAGTPALAVRFGPFAEFGGNAPVWAAHWDAASFANAIQRLLDDPVLARAQVQARLEVAATLSWDRSAEAHVRVYRKLLSRPSALSNAVRATHTELGRVAAESEDRRRRLEEVERSRAYRMARRISALRPRRRAAP